MLLYDLDERERRTILRLVDRAWAAANDLREKAVPNSDTETDILAHQQHLEAIMAKLR